MTAARTPDGRLAVIYLPTQRHLGGPLGDGRRDPGGLDRPHVRDAPARALSASFTTPGANARGDHDWLLVLTS